MGSPLSPSVANFYMEKFEEKALETATLRPTVWLRYVDDVFAIWPHGREELQNFLVHLNSQHENIKFTIEIEENNKLPFLDVLLEKQNNGKLLHTVYRKPTHTNQYLHGESNHHPAQKFSTIRSLYNRADTLCHPDKLEEEKNFLSNILAMNGYSKSFIRRAVTRKTRQNTLDDNSETSFTTLPYVKNVTDKIGRVLRKYDICTSFKSTLKIRDLIGNVKDKLHLQSSGIYRTPCECGEVYIGQTGRTVATRLKEHERNIRLNYPEKSAIAQHAIENLHGIDFKNTRILAREEFLVRRLIREAIEIHKHRNNFNHSSGFELDSSWLPILHTPALNQE